MAVAQFLKPKIKILYNGKDTTERMFWSNIRINDNEGDEADSLNITLKWGNELPRLKDDISVYADDEFLGAFKISALKYNYFKSIEIEAISADFMSYFKTKKNRTFENKSYKQVIQTIADENSYKAKIDFERMDEVVSLEQYNKSDSALLQEIADELELSFSVKNKTIIFLEKSKDTERLTYEINAKDCLSLNWQEKETPHYECVEVTFHNTKTNKDEVARAGKGEPVMKLTISATSPESALKTAQAKLKAQNNARFDGSLSIMGRAYFAGAYINLQIGSEVKKVIAKKITHNINTAWISDIEFF